MKVTAVNAAGGLGLISDWYGLGSALRVSPSTMAYALTFRNELQQPVRHKDRPLYKSAPALKFVQTRIGMLASNIMNSKEHENVVLAYRQGISPVNVLSQYQNSHALITTDVRKYYPSIRLEHIESSLMDAGMNSLGARLTGRYCIVERHGLQQGSTASSAVSNLVGYRYIDLPVLHWLAEQGVQDDVGYIRYCDNMALFLLRNLGENFYKEFKDFFKEKMQSNGFRLHHWCYTSNNSRYRPQKFLGVVLNHAPRVAKDRLGKLRAVCFSLCRTGYNEAAARILVEGGGVGEQPAHSFVYGVHSAAADKLRSKLIGNASYVGMINKRHGLWLTKLIKAADLLDRWCGSAMDMTFHTRMLKRQSYELAKLLFRYRKHETLEEFLARIEEWTAENS